MDNMKNPAARQRGRAFLNVVVDRQKYSLQTAKIPVLPPELLRARSAMLADPMNAGAFSRYQQAHRAFADRIGGAA